MANILGGGPAGKGRGKKKERVLVQENVLVFSKHTSRILSSGDNIYFWQCFLQSEHHRT
jgi:hypothetical protein